jgi:hypothetical protein
MRFQTAHFVDRSAFLLLADCHGALTSISKKGGLLALAFRTNICHIARSVSHLDELGLDAEEKISVDEFTRKREMTYDSNRWSMTACLSL